MSRVDYAARLGDYPKIKKTIVRLLEWMDAHTNIHFIYPTQIINEVGVSEDDLMIACALLVQDGTLRRFYRIRPRTSNSFVRGTFASPEGIPGKLRGNFDEVIDREESEIVTVFGRPDSAEER